MAIRALKRTIRPARPPTAIPAIAPLLSLGRGGVVLRGIDDSVPLAARSDSCHASAIWVTKRMPGCTRVVLLMFVSFS